MTKRVIAVGVFILFGSSVAFGFVLGGANLGFGGYSQFRSFLAYNPSKSDVQFYVDDAKTYVENCSADIQRIQEAMNDAVQKANDAVRQYNNRH